MSMALKSYFAARLAEMNKLVEQLGDWETIYRDHPDRKRKDWLRMSVGEAVAELRRYAGVQSLPDAQQLAADVDRLILESLSVNGRVVTAKQIKGLLGHKKYSLFYIQRRLGPKMPLQKFGFIERPPGHDGYRRLR